MKNTVMYMLFTSSLAGAMSVTAHAQSSNQTQSINQRQAALDARINAGVNDRSLTAVEAAQLRADFQDIAKLEMQYRVSGRNVTQAESNDLNRRFNQLSSRIQTNRNDNDIAGPGINARQAELDARINAGVNDRSLTAAEASQLRAEFQDIAQLEMQYRVSGRSVTQAESDDLNRRFNQLSNRIQNNRNDNDLAGPGINARQVALDTRIDAGVRDRSLTTAEASQLRAEFQDIAQLETQYRVSGRNVTQAESNDLNRRFDLLSDRIQNGRNNNDSRWTNLNQRQSQFNGRLSRAVSDRRVTQQEASGLRSEFNTIARLEGQYRQSRPGITAWERDDLNARFNRLEVNYRTSINNSSYGTGSRQYPSLFEFLFGI